MVIIRVIPNLKDHEMKDNQGETLWYIQRTSSQMGFKKIAKKLYLGTI